MDFDPIRGVFVIWYGGSDVWELEPPIPVAPTGCTFRRVSAPTGPVPTMNVETGVMGKWKYIPNLDAYMGLQDAQNGHVWLFKPYNWQPPSGPPSNLPPSVTITSPGNGASFTQGTPVTVDATASDSDGSVAKVDFYSDGTLVGSDTTS
ncbi:MAG: hypothetical protein IT518_27365, partial [Burkholderiales bacterium]|nr:hypothetical protein [Burkholderiales bacterium]